MLLLLCGCEWKLRSTEEDDGRSPIEVQRYDRLQSLYLQTGDFSALQQMNTSYPMETRTLIENVLQIGPVDDPEINNKFLRFYQDTTLQAVITDVAATYAKMDDVNKDLDMAFLRLEKAVPGFPVPTVYAQIGAFAQSIVIGNQSIGISLDKYLGAAYPLYQRYGYTAQQLQMMEREYIVPDCITFYLLSLYPLHDFETRPQMDRDLHMGKVMWVANKVLSRQVFKSEYVKRIDRYMRRHPSFGLEQLLKMDDYKGV
ncbi:MAG: gliding motility protein GldB [Prevotella sp.]|jgi:hypothetical protein|nr:gliding motility protein GldB [Prevotella sp.]